MAYLPLVGSGESIDLQGKKTVSAGQMLHGTNALSLTSENGKVSSADTNNTLTQPDKGVKPQDQHNPSSMRQARANTEVTDRELLADAAEGIAENQSGRKALEAYKDGITGECLYAAPTRGPALLAPCFRAVCPFIDIIQDIRGSLEV